ncbi:hypothetical protein AX14_003015, partial [Amanita brunnescens Koide BX004]
MDSPNIVLASRFRGGARSTKSSKKGSSSSASSQSSGPGSLATAHSQRNSPDPFVTTGEGVTPPQVTQSSTDEIDAFADQTIRIAVPLHGMPATRATAPSPSSNLPPASAAPAPVFHRPDPPVLADSTENVPTATPSRAPSRTASVASTGDAGIATLLQPDAFAQPSEPPAFSDVIGRIHRRYPLASLKVDDEDSHHFLARDNTRVEDIANETEYLLSSATSWPSILYFLRDIMKFDSIKGSIAEFQVVLAGLAEIWSDAADIDAREVLHNMIEAVRLMPKAEKEIDRLEATATRYRSEPSLLDFLLPSSPFTFDVPPPPLPLRSLPSSALSSMAPGENWMTMRRKSPSSPKPSAQLPAQQLSSPLLPLFAPSSAPRPASTLSSAARAADGCPSPDTYWAQPDRTDWDFDNNIYCDSTGCSYDAKKNPRIAKYAVTVAEFDDCSYEEYEDTVFLCGQCNMKCLRKVNGSKIKKKTPIEQFLAQREAIDDSDSFAVAALDLPLPAPSASDFPELPRAAPAPKMTKAEKAMANKINALLLSDVKGKPSPAPTATAAKPTGRPKEQIPDKAPAQNNYNDDAVAPAAATVPPKSAATPGILPVTGSMRGETPTLSPSSQQSGASTPIMAMATFHAEHAVSCSHDTDSCGVCRVGITCCKCHLMYTAPAAKRMRCAKCLHWACDLDQSIGCCECNTPWVPLAVLSPPRADANFKPTARFRGGAGSDNASVSDESRDDSTVKIKIAAPTQESVDEIDAFSRPPSSTSSRKVGKPKTRRRPKSGQSSREPSRPSSVASDLISTAETTLHKPDYEVPPLAHEYVWSPPPVDPKTLPGYVYEAHQEKTLHVDDEDVTHFLKRGDVDINDLSNQLDILLSGNSSWKTIYHAITDLFQFDSIAGTRNDFICLLIGLARSWDDNAECNPAGIVKTLINDASALAAMQDIVNTGGVAPTPAQFEQLQQEVALLKDEKAGLTKVIEHDKAALRAAEEENAAMTLQVSLQNEDIDDKNALIEEYQVAATDMLRKYGEMEILATSAKHELESAKVIITTMKAQQTAEQKVYESRIERLKARGAVDPDLPSAKGDESLRKELAVAKERVAFLERAYKEKSDALKAANTAAKKQGNQQAPPKSTTKSPNLPKWGFEPSDDLPNSQPYWDYRNAYSDHIAAMVAATVTAIPHIPLASAISSAISTVSKAGPPPELAQKNKGKRPSG